MIPHLLLALADFGVREIPGASSSADIMAMAHFLGASYPTDETAWCGLALASWVKRSGGTPPEGYLGARNWLTWGDPVEDPSLGDVVVLWRTAPAAWEGHVGIFITQRDDEIFLLGGNQGNAVSVMPYPEVRVLGVRRG